MIKNFSIISLFLLSSAILFAGESKKEFKKTSSFINTVYESNKRISSAFTDEDSSQDVPRERDESFKKRQKEVNEFYKGFNRKVVLPKTDDKKSKEAKPEQAKKPKARKVKDENATTAEDHAIYLKNRTRSYDEIMTNFEPYGQEKFEFGEHTFSRSGVYIVYFKKMLYFLVGGRVYGPKISTDNKGYINKWMSPEEFMKYGEDEDYSAYCVGRFKPMQMKKFHIFWLANYNNKKLAEISTNACYYTDILNKLNNYEVKFYTMEQDKRNYFTVRNIMKEKERLFPPIEETFEGEFEQDDDE